MRISEEFILWFILLAPLVLGASMWALRGWKHYWKFFGFNGLLVLTYVIILASPAFSYLGHDEYGLRRIGFIVVAPAIHIWLGGVFALYYRMRLRIRHATAH